MAQCMEAWLAADPEALEEDYDEGFNAQALPKRINLEEEPKTQIYAALKTPPGKPKKAAMAKSNMPAIC